MMYKGKEHMKHKGHGRYANKVVSNILGPNYKNKKVEIEKERGKLEVEWEDD